MICRGIKWGVIHNGSKMYVLRVEKKNSRPFIVISGVVEVGETTPPAPIALICYMVLTGIGDTDAVGPALARVPEPPKSDAPSSKRYNFGSRGDSDEDEDGDGEEDDDEEEEEKFTPPNRGLHIQVYFPCLFCSAQG
jgi:hypothetical protein